MKTIAVATDLSERSDRAVARALRLSRELNAECRVISIVDDALPDDLAAELRDATERRLRAMLEEAQGTTTVVVDVGVGDVAPGILELSEGADLLVLGLHRPRAFLDGLRETTLERIVSFTKTPVLLVRNPAKFDYRKVLTAVSFSPSCASAVAAACRVAPGSAMTAFHALHIPFQGLSAGSRDSMDKSLRVEADELMESWRVVHGVPLDKVQIIAGSVTLVLDRLMKSVQPDLLAIGVHTRHGLAFHGLGAFAASLVRDPPTDLLLARG